jgi:quercetin dioxygenase-like cupin family protein
MNLPKPVVAAGRSLPAMKAESNLHFEAHAKAGIKAKHWLSQQVRPRYIVRAASCKASAVISTQTSREKFMSLKVRRVVTGHDASGRAVVKIDEFAKNISSRRPGASSTVIWSTDTFPVINEGDDDGSEKVRGTTLENGTVFRVVRYEPGVTPRRHRTDSVDYAVVMSGEIDMELDGTTVTLKAGDVLVQRGTIHNWVNRSKDVAVVAFVLVAAKSVTAGGKTLDAIG